VQGFRRGSACKNRWVDAEQIARNDSIFRDANERIERAAKQYPEVERAPFICECADLSCREVVLLTLEEYTRVRSRPTHFVVAPGHEEVATGAVEVVERGERYVVTKKIGKAGAVATDLDPRGC
jgi:hypothetical protein